MDCITHRNDLKYCIIVALILIIPASVSAFNPILSGDRNLGQDYQFTVKNVTGLNQNIPGSDVTYNWSVYDYRLIGSDYNYYSVDWGRWFQQDADPGYQFLIIWVRSEMTGNTSWYGWGPDRFKVWIWDNTTIHNQTTPMQDLPIKYKGDQYRPVVISELQELNSRINKKLLSREWYGWKDEIELDRQEPGTSTAWDGMILYQIPEAATADDIRVMGYSWYGYSVWYLTHHDNLIQEKQKSLKAKIVPTVTETPIIRGADPKPKPSQRMVR